MTQPDLPAELVRRGQPPTFAELVAAEEAQVAAGTAEGCGATCGCHGNLICIRATHPHDPGADMGPGKPRGDVVPHVGRDDSGQLVQWVCPCPP